MQEIRQRLCARHCSPQWTRVDRGNRHGAQRGGDYFCVPNPLGRKLNVERATTASHHHLVGLGVADEEQSRCHSVTPKDRQGHEQYDNFTQFTGTTKRVAGKTAKPSAKEEA